MVYWVSGPWKIVHFLEKWTKIGMWRLTIHSKKIHCTTPCLLSIKFSTIMLSIKWNQPYHTERDISLLSSKLYVRFIKEKWQKCKNSSDKQPTHITNLPVIRPFMLFKLMLFIWNELSYQNQQYHTNGLCPNINISARECTIACTTGLLMVWELGWKICMSS